MEEEKMVAVASYKMSNDGEGHASIEVLNCKTSGDAEGSDVLDVIQTVCTDFPILLEGMGEMDRQEIAQYMVVCLLDMATEGMEEADE